MRLLRRPALLREPSIPRPDNWPPHNARSKLRKSSLKELSQPCIAKCTAAVCGNVSATGLGFLNALPSAFLHSASGTFPHSPRASGSNGVSLAVSREEPHEKEWIWWRRQYHALGEGRASQGRNQGGRNRAD